MVQTSHVIEDLVKTEHIIVLDMYEIIKEGIMI